MSACVGNSEEPLTFLLDIVELPATTAEAIHTALLNNLSHHGFTEDIFKERLVCFACDGASVMLGRKSGVAIRVVNQFPSIFICHCINHSLELSIGDAVEEAADLNQFRSFFDKLYSLYHASAKNQIELTACCETLSMQCQNLG